MQIYPLQNHISKFDFHFKDISAISYVNRRSLLLNVVTKEDTVFLFSFEKIISKWVMANVKLIFDKFQVKTTCCKI